MFDNIDFLKVIFDFAKNAWSQSVLIVMIFFQWYVINQQLKRSMLKDDINKNLIEINVKQNMLIDKLADEIKEIKNELNRNTEKVLWSVWKTIIDEKNLIYIAKRCVRSACIEKLDFLDNMLALDDITHNQEEKKKQITSQLKRFSRDLYVDPLNEFSSKRWPVWDWIGITFPMERFLEEIFKIFFNIEIDRYKKRKLFLNIMELYQNSLWEEFKIYLDYGDFNS